MHQINMWLVLLLWIASVLSVPSVALEVQKIENVAKLREEFVMTGKTFLRDNVFVFKDDDAVKNFQHEVERFDLDIMQSKFVQLDTVEAFLEMFQENGANVDAVFLKIGTEFRDIDILNSAYRFGEEYGFTDWIASCLKVEIGWVNFLEEPLTLYWFDHIQEDPVEQEVIKPGERNTVWRESYLGHRFFIKLPNGTQNWYTVTTDLLFPVGEFPSLIGSIQEPSEELYSKLLQNEKRRATRVWRTFTDTGYKRIPAPPKLFADITRWWNMNRERSFLEDWKHRGIYVNYWQTDIRMIPPPFSLKKKWHLWFMPIVEEWTNMQRKLEPTDIYGIRTYHRGSVLLDHVDREETHAVSAIINVDQGGIEEDWELEIYDVNGNVVHSPLNKGEAMLYESAKCLHGRPKPLNGDFYANIFFHYRPKNDAHWFRKNPDGSPILQDPNQAATTQNYDDEDDDDYDDDEDDDYYDDEPEGDLDPDPYYYDADPDPSQTAEREKDEL